MNEALLVLSVIVFPGGFNLPTWAAERQGFFQSNGVRVALTLTPSSTFQMQGLAEGRFDIAMTAFDNVIAYQEGQGEAKIPDNPDMFVFMGSDNGFLSVMGGKGVQRFAELTTGKMALFISHRFSTVRMADRIVVLENGRIAEDGNHDQLTHLGGRYAEMFELQAASYR